MDFFSLIAENKALIGLIAFYGIEKIVKFTKLPYDDIIFDML